MDILNAMVIVGIKGANHHFICPVSDCKGANKDMVIPMFSSMDKAKDQGWIFTDNDKFCPPDSDFVAICPNCVNRFNININEYQL